MLYDLSKPLDAERFNARAKALAGRGVVVELTEKTKRTLPQNAYLHLIIGVVAMETGNTIDYCKEVYFKRMVNPALFLRDVNDPLAGKVSILRSSTDLAKEEMSNAIDRFKKWAAENGIYIPEPGDAQRIAEIQLEMDRCRKYL